MVCLHCGQKTSVINSRSQKRLNQVWRRRQCLNCGAIFTTEERGLYADAWAVRDRAGNLQPFSRDKLFLSLYQSCQHRPNAVRDAAALADTVIHKLLGDAASGVFDRQTITHAALVALNRFDKAASVHYAAFHAKP